jgi:hypothetical protein
MVNIQDMNLRDALHKFRQVATIKKFSHAVLKNSGLSIVMLKGVLQCIVDCAHLKREQLEKETRWVSAIWEKSLLSDLQTYEKIREDQVVRPRGAILF